MTIGTLMTHRSSSAFALVLVALGGPVLAQDCAEGLRAFEHGAGTACLPQQPSRIVAVRGDSIATPLLDIGAPVVGSATLKDAETGEDFIRGATDILGIRPGEASGILSIGGDNEPDLEAIAALSPDLIMLPGWQSDLHASLSAIAPTVVVPENLPFLEHLAFVADAAGMAEVYAEREAAYRERIEEIRAMLGDTSGITVSRLDMADGELWFYPNWGAVDQVIDDLGFARPEPQTQGPQESFSLELLGEFDGDLILSSYAPRFGQTVETLQADWDGFAPRWRDLAGVADGGHHWYPRDAWTGYTFHSLDEVADGLLLLTLGRFDGTE